jgi:hypothetical protein
LLKRRLFEWSLFEWCLLKRRLLGRCLFKRHLQCCNVINVIKIVKTNNNLITEKGFCCNFHHYWNLFSVHKVWTISRFFLHFEQTSKCHLREWKRNSSFVNDPSSNFLKDRLKTKFSSLLSLSSFLRGLQIDKL